MITGVVQDREGRIRLKIRGPRGTQRDIQAIVDTGCNCWLTMPPAVIAALGLPWHGFGHGGLADGTEVLFDVYHATVVWDRVKRRIPVVEADTTALVGRSLLEGYELTMQVRAGGKVTIKRLV